MLYQLNYWRVNDKRLASLFVHRVTTAPGAILLDLHTIRHGCLVLGRRVVATLALSACKGDESTHESITSKYRPQRARWKRLASYLRRCQCDVPCRGLSADTFHIFRRYVRLSPHGSAQHTCRRPVTRPHRKGPSPEMEPGPLKSAKPRLLRKSLSYSMMVLTTPEPTVWPPSRIAKRRPSSMAIG